MNAVKRLASTLSIVFVVLASTAFASGEITVFKGATCSCCLKWMEHLRKAGFQVRSSDVAYLGAVQSRFGVPERLRSCHTAVIGGYVIEGHVPVADIERLLRERPPIAGLAAPGMPIGSPGMEGANPRPYSVVSFTKDGQTAVFATH